MNSDIYFLCCCWCHSQRPKPSIPLVALTTYSAVLQVPIFKSIQNYLSSTDFSSLHNTQPLPQLRWPPQLLPFHQSCLHVFSWRFPLKMSTRLFWPLSKDVSIPEAPISGPMFFMTPLWNHMDYSVPQPFASLNFCFSLSANASVSHYPLWSCIPLSVPLLHYFYNPHYITYSFRRGTKSCASFVFPKNQRQYQSHSRCSARTCYVILEFILG